MSPIGLMPGSAISMGGPVGAGPAESEPSPPPASDELPADALAIGVSAVDGVEGLPAVGAAAVLTGAAGAVLSGTAAGAGAFAAEGAVTDLPTTGAEVESSDPGRTS